MSARLRIQAAKEFRALWPWWAGTVGAMVACSALGHFPGNRLFSTVVVFVYVAGAVALGALSIVHEYTHGTLGALLAQPIDRRRVLVTKFAVLIPLLASLGIVAALTLGTDPHFRPASAPGAWAAMAIRMCVPALLGVGLAPWLTMICRGPLAGAVFSAALPAALWSIGLGVLGVSRVGSIVWWGPLWLAGVGAVMTWRTFLRLEAIDGPQGEIDALAWLPRRAAAGGAATRPRSHVWLLIRKELRLQQMTFVTSGLCAAAWLVAVVAGGLGPRYVGGVAVIWTLHFGLIPLLAGSLASAEERQMSTGDWQTLLPMAGWKQWAIKAGLAIALTVLLVIGLPALLSAIHRSPDDLRFLSGRDVIQVAMLVVMLCVAALYVSSLSTNSLRALLTILPAIAGAALVGASITDLVERFISPFLQPLAQRLTAFHGLDWRDVTRLTALLVRDPLVAGLALLMLRFGSQNHRLAHRDPTTVRRQVGWMVTYVVCATVILSFASQLVKAALTRPPL